MFSLRLFLHLFKGAKKLILFCLHQRECSICYPQTSRRCYKNFYSVGILLYHCPFVELNHHHKVEGHHSQPESYHLRGVRKTVVLKWILGILRSFKSFIRKTVFYVYIKHYLRKITFKPISNIIREAHTFHFLLLVFYDL